MIVHFDLDAFYASVAQRDDPALRGRPLAVAGKSRRAVVLTASYEARPFGVRSAMPLYAALERCPQLVVVVPDHTRYREVSRAVFAIFSDGARAVEGLSLDEAFVDTGASSVHEAAQFARRVRERVRDEVGLTASAGVASVKMVAKIASDACKPDGLAIVEEGREAEYLAPFPVGRLWGVGPKAQARLAREGIATIGDLAGVDDERAFRLFGRSGRSMRDLARGIDEREVVSDSLTRSVSTEETFEYDVRDEAALTATLHEQALEVARRLANAHLCAATVGIKIKRADFRILGRQTHLAEPSNDAPVIEAAALHCLQRAELHGQPVRLLGVRAATLSHARFPQLALFEG